MPPVTAERSPPLSRMTGADSPVIAASLTEATPSITSPSLGIRSPASTSTISPGLSDAAGDGARLRVAGRQQLGHRVGLGLAQGRGLGLAAAFGDRFGEIGEQHREPEPEIDLEGEGQMRPPVDRSRMNRIVVRVATISTTNITGLRIMMARIELAEGAADRRNQDLRIGDGGEGACACGTLAIPMGDVVSCSAPQ